MEKVKKSFRETVPAVSLYRQDLDELIAILKGTCEEVTIQSGDYTFESLDELQKEFGNRPTSLSINGRVPYISLTLRRPEPTSVHGGETTILACTQLVEILRKCRKPLSYVFTTAGCIAFGLVPFLLSLVWLKYNSAKYVSNNFISVFAILSVFPSFFCWPYYAVGLGYSIHLQRRHETTNWLQRYWPDIVKFAITGFLGWTAKWLYDYLRK